MWCSTCQRDNDAGAVFCAYCGRAFHTAPPGNKPNTGSTIDLGRRNASQAEASLPKSVTPQPPMVVPPPAHSHAHSGQSIWKIIIGAIVLFLLLRGFFFPMLGFVGRFWWLGLIIFFVCMNRGSCSRTRNHPRTWHH